MRGDMSEYKRADFVSSQEVRWCPGCGDYAILASIQKLLPELGIAPKDTVFISGIGCAGRLPYYINTYGFHGIHGRAPAIASGLKLMRDDLSVWIITGDGDGLSIGTNHLIHCLRRNLNVNILLFNNQIYGLTKGQFSPTSLVGQTTKTSPLGVADKPINPIELALSAGASFVARAIDKNPKQLGDILKAAHAHQGASFVEIYQNCNIFNDCAFDSFAVKAERAQNTLELSHGKPFCFGEDNQWALEKKQGKMVIVDNYQELKLTHDVTNKLSAYEIAALHYPNFPVPIGIIYQQQEMVKHASDDIKANSERLANLFRGDI
jgi:2-oxoglutarate/2-oxoacid ferredoxin oxidoreductase subunit beta